MPIQTTPTPSPTLAEYASRGLRIALIGGPAAGKKHVFKTLDAKRTPTHNLRLYVHTSTPREDFRAQLDELKKLISDTHDLPDPRDHVYLVWYFPLARWEAADGTFVKELSMLCDVIVVIAKADLRSLQIDPSTGNTEAEEIETAVRQQFHDIPIVHCADPTLYPTFWTPPRCANGHGRANFVIQPSKQTWKCLYAEHDNSSTVCNDSHIGEYQPWGYDRLLEQSLALLPKLHQRALHRVQEVLERREKRRLWVLVAVGLALFAAAVKFGTSVFSSGDSEQLESPHRLAKL